MSDIPQTTDAIETTRILDSKPNGVIDPRSSYEIRHQALEIAISARWQNEDLIELAIDVEGFLLGDNSRVRSPEPPQTSDSEPDSGMRSEMKSTRWPNRPKRQ